MPHRLGVDLTGRFGPQEVPDQVQVANQTLWVHRTRSTDQLVGPQVLYQLLVVCQHFEQHTFVCERLRAAKTFSWRLSRLGLLLLKSSSSLFSEKAADGCTLEPKLQATSFAHEFRFRGLC